MFLVEKQEKLFLISDYTVLSRGLLKHCSYPQHEIYDGTVVYTYCTTGVDTTVIGLPVIPPTSTH